MKEISLIDTKGEKVSVTEEEFLKAILAYQREVSPPRQIFITENNKRVAVLLPVKLDKDDKY